MPRHTAPGRPADARTDAAILSAGRGLLFSRGPQAVSMEAVARITGAAEVARCPNGEAPVSTVTADRGVTWRRTFAPA